MIPPGEPSPADALAEAEQIAIPLARPPHRLRPRPTPRQARRLDRLSRAVHRFHRHAHHPLCDRYAGEVLRLGGPGHRLYLCRGCSFAALGGAAGIAAGLFAGLAAVGALPVIALGAATLLLIPTVVSHRRLPKLVTRVLPAALFALAITAGLVAHRFALAAAAAGIVVGLRLVYARRGGDRTPCATCPERTASPCSGFVQIVRREQAFQRLARRVLG